jgi:hypothetical protein
MLVLVLTRTTPIPYHTIQPYHLYHLFLSFSSSFVNDWLVYGMVMLNDMEIAARKTQLIQNLKNAFLYHSNPSAAGLATPTPVASTPLSSSSSSHVQPSSSHSRGYGASSSAYETYGGSHHSSIHPPNAHSNSAAMYASSYGHAPQQSSHGGHPASSSVSSSYYQSHGHTAPPTAARIVHPISSGGITNASVYGSNSNTNMAQLSSSSSSNPSSDPDFIDVKRLMALPEFNSGRDPFHKVEQLVARKGLTPNKTQIIQFNLTPDIVSRL